MKFHSKEGLAMDYRQWNTCLRDYFFNPDAAGKEVVLFADRPLINRLGARHGADVDDFIRAVTDGTQGTGWNSVCQNAHRKFKDWRDSWGRPQYIGYLVFFVLAAGQDGDYSVNAYYPRLNKLLGLPVNSGAPASFNRMYQLWEDLEVWSKSDMMETLGRFTARVRGRWIHVGLPLSQTLLTAEEKSSLPSFYASSGFDPTSPPSGLLLGRRMLAEPGLLHARTRRILQKQEDGMHHLKDSLIEYVLADLSEWDGSTGTVGSGTENPDGRVYGALRIGLHYDPVSWTVKTTVRFKINRDLPEEEMLFIRLGDTSIWKCNNFIQSWTTEFSSVSDKRLLDASQLNWLHGEAFSDEEGNWKVQLKGAAVRVFMEGIREKLPRWIETNRIDNNGKYLLACCASHAEDISLWGAESCEVFRSLSVDDGLPEGWRLYELTNIRESHPLIDVLQLPSIHSVTFSGGLRTGRGNKFFAFAPPEIVVEGISGDYEVTVSGQKAGRTESGTWALPPGMPSGQPVQVEVIAGDAVIKTSFQLEEPSIAPDYTSFKRDRYGKKMEGDDSYCTVSGADVRGGIVQEFPAYTPGLPTYLSHRIKFLGTVPGQIAEWPGRSIPFEWQPVWAIARVKRDKWQAYYIGAVQDISHSPVFRRELHEWKKWKKAFTYLNVSPPGFDLATVLWRHYKEGARRL